MKFSVRCRIPPICHRNAKQSNAETIKRSGKMDLFAYESHLTDKEQAILADLFKYRVLTTDMIRNRHFDGKGRYVENVLMKLRKEGYIRTSTLKRSRKGRKGYSVHQLTETGRECLARHDKSVEGQSSRSIYVKDYQIPNLLLANEMLLTYEKMGWETWDSRKTKTIYNLDYRDNIQGLVISPKGKKYGLYALEINVAPNTIGRIQSEMRKNHKIIPNYMVIPKGSSSYNDFITYAVGNDKEGKDEQKRLLTSGELRIEPTKINIGKSSKYESQEIWIRKLCELYDLELKSLDKKEGERQSFPVIIEHKGEEKYLIDLTDSDTNKLNDIELYTGTNSGYRWEKRKVLAITFGTNTKLYKKIKEIHNEAKIDLIEMSDGDMISLIT